ncbi:MAG TPA: GNAT family N-acetyltransferase [Pyrinomonadaceae bacterium]|nr:GNAT family N-acetyltransferase [Pyrinomonadaceae bacterium]
MADNLIFLDKEFSKRLERTEARANADFVEARVRLEPESDAAWIDIAGTYAMYDGSDSPLTQTFGLGLFTDDFEKVLDQAEEFFKKRDAPVFHEVSPLADASLLGVLCDRGYRPIEWTNVMFRELAGYSQIVDARFKIRIVDADEGDLWAKTAAAGWATEFEGIEEFMYGIGRVSANAGGTMPFLAELEGRPVGTGALAIYDDACLLAGASTVPAARRQGAQTALLAARLNFAREQGCSLAMMGASPGSQSQKNAQKNGFSIAYTRIKWQLLG